MRVSSFPRDTLRLDDRQETLISSISHQGFQLTSMSRVIFISVSESRRPVEKGPFFQAGNFNVHTQSYHRLSRRSTKETRGSRGGTKGWLQAVHGVCLKVGIPEHIALSCKACCPLKTVRGREHRWGLKSRVDYGYCSMFVRCRRYSDERIVGFFCCSAKRI